MGVSRTTIQNIEAGKFQKVTSTIREYARLLGLDEQWIDRVMSGEQPAQDASGASAGADDGGQQDAAGLGLSPAVEYELRTSETLGSAVINLGPDEDDGHVIVVLQGRKGATPEEVARIAARYRKARRILQGIASEPDDEVADS